MGSQLGAWLLDVAAGTAGPKPAVTQNLLELAHRHGLLGLLADPEAPWFWPEVLPLHARLVARQQVMLVHLRELAKAFHNAGVPMAVLKGPWLAEAVYRNPAHRTFSDLDLLVPAEALEAALDLVREHEGVRGIPRQKPEADKREIPVRDPSGVTFAVNLHWDLFSYRQLAGRARQATAEAWKSALLQTDSPLGPVWELPLSATWVFLGTHATLDHRFRLILFRDLAELSRLADRWSEVEDYATEHGLRSTTYIAVELARRWVGAPIPDEVTAQLRPRSLPVAAIEWLAGRIDPLTFDGHRPHPLNLAMVLAHDDRWQRVKQVARAPAAVPGWWRKVRSLPALPGLPLATIVVASTRRRGAEVFGEQLAQGLFQSGWQTDLVALSRTPEGPEIAAVSLSEEAGRPARFDLRIIWRLRRRLRETQPKVVLANGSATLKYSVAALAGMRRPPALLYASVGEPGYWTIGRVRTLVQRFLLSRVDKVLAVSAETARQLEYGFGQEGEKVVVAETGVDPRLLTVVPAADRGHGLRILVLGSLSEEKDPVSAVAVCAQLARTNTCRLRLVGAGPLESEVKAAAAALGLEVELTGPVSDVAPHLEWAHVLLLTSRTEGLPGSVLEAGAAAVPAVGFDVGGVREAIIDGTTGLVVAAGDTVGAAAALARLADDPQLRRQLGEGARHHVASRFLLPHAIDRYRLVIESVRLQP